MTPDYKQQITQRLAKDLLDIQLLRIVAKESMWGYRIKKAFEAEVGLKLRHGVLYPTLNKLEREGFFACEKQQQSGRARKTYSLTAKGKQYLQTYYVVLEEQLDSQRVKQRAE